MVSELRHVTQKMGLNPSKVDVIHVYKKVEVRLRGKASVTTILTT